jgi:hypothetical protein
MRFHERKMAARLDWLIAVFVLISSVAVAQSPTASPEPAASRNPVRTIKIDRTRFDYYENPQSVAASTTFYVSGSETNSLVFDFIAITIAFANHGLSLRPPTTVNFHFVVATYRDGCKIRDRYADNGRLRVTLGADDVSLYQTDLVLTVVSETKTRNGKMCLESYGFDMPFESLSKLVAARKASLTLGPRSLDFQRKHLDALKVLVNGIGRY